MSSHGLQTFRRFNASTFQRLLRRQVVRDVVLDGEGRSLSAVADAELVHVLLVGAGAARFAAEMGFEPAELRTEESMAIWRARLEESDPYHSRMRELAARLASDAEVASEQYNEGGGVTGTVNFIARDGAGRIALATSTSGWAWKYPGRVGDTPIVGAGGYADSRFGAAACTGRGEMAVRAGTAHAVVLYMKMGLPLWNACREAVHDLYSLDDPYASGLHVIALDAQGSHAGFSTRAGTAYLFQRADMEAPTLRPRTVVDRDGKATLRPQ